MLQKQAMLLGIAMIFQIILMLIILLILRLLVLRDIIMVRIPGTGGIIILLNIGQ